MNFWDTCTWIAPSRISAGSSASSPDPAVISFRHSIGHAHAIRDIFWADLQCWDPILLFSLKQLRVKQICFPWDADRFGICTIFYRDYQGLHQMRKDLVLCALRRQKIFVILYFLKEYTFLRKSVIPFNSLICRSQIRTFSWQWCCSRFDPKLCVYDKLPLDPKQQSWLSLPTIRQGLEITNEICFWKSDFLFVKRFKTFKIRIPCPYLCVNLGMCIELVV